MNAYGTQSTEGLCCPNGTRVVESVWPVVLISLTLCGRQWRLFFWFGEALWKPCTGRAHLRDAACVKALVQVTAEWPSASDPTNTAWVLLQTARERESVPDSLPDKSFPL